MERTAVSVGHRPGILLVGHGTRDANGTRQFFELGQQLASVASQRFGPGAVVAPCLLEFQSPTIEEAWQELEAKQVTDVIVVPLLLFSAGHAKSDIPDEVAKARQRFPIEGLNDVVWCRPISRSSSMVELVRRRLGELRERTYVTDPQRVGIVMVGRGSRDPCATSDMKLLTEVALRGGESLQSQWSMSNDAVFTTFYAMAQPRLPDTLAEIASSKRFDQVLVQPHLLFEGRLYDAIKRQVDQANCDHIETEFHLGDYLGPVDLVAEAVLSRLPSDANTFKTP
ncbi:MAG: sirohydrochlorin chelatase [Planctomycetota bacterium]